MSKQAKVSRLASPTSAHARGRTAKTTAPDASTPNAREGNVSQERITEAARAMGAGGGGGKRRGDRRDMSRLYTGNAKHASRGSNPRPDVKTRKR